MKERIRKINEAPVCPAAEYVLYWASMNHRTRDNHGLAYAVALGNELGLPVLCAASLSASYPEANERMHVFFLEGIRDFGVALGEMGIGFAFFLDRGGEAWPWQELAGRAAAVVTDEFPVAAALRLSGEAPEWPVAAFAVDSCGVIPMSRFEKREYAAYTIRPKVHKMLPQYLSEMPVMEVAHRYAGVLPAWHTEVQNVKALAAGCPVDHTVGASTTFRGGQVEARRRFDEFLKKRFVRYGSERNEPSKHATSNMSPYLHFGHMSALRLSLDAGAAQEQGLGTAAEYLEELIVRRELAFNFARFAERHDSLEVLPEWAQKTLRAHDGDKRPWLYDSGQLERGETHDPLWNATQKEMVLRGKIHGYYRMYWGKKAIEWTASHAEALSWMIRIHDKYAIDGRDPCTYTNILWLFGLHDRPWTERAVFGQIRYMGYDGMKRKTDIQSYMQEIAYLERNGKDPYPV